MFGVYDYIALDQQESNVLKSFGLIIPGNLVNSATVASQYPCLAGPSKYSIVPLWQNMSLCVICTCILSKYANVI